MISVRRRSAGVGARRRRYTASVHWSDDAATQLERLTGDPIADAVSGSVVVISVSERRGRARYQECRLDVSVDAPGIEPITVTLEVVTTARSWPVVGAVLPARVSRSQPSRIDVDWDALAR